MNTSKLASSQRLSELTQRRISNRTHQRGFTLVEAMVTLSLAAASLTAGVPMLKDVANAIDRKSVV